MRRIPVSDFLPALAYRSLLSPLAPACPTECSDFDVLRRAIADGVARVRGYLHWSLTDNYEWAPGYAMRFGQFSYDPGSLARTARPSAALYGRIASGGA
jgi:hypothetical protein